jgi:precorrin-3B C17-methyltransferase
MTGTPWCALESSDILCGYTKYIELVKDVFPEKEVFSTPMMQETERCREALKLASGGKTVSLVCSGDAGVYGMAAPVSELAAEYEDVDIEIIPGVTAALSGAAILVRAAGSRLLCDLAVRIF